MLKFNNVELTQETILQTRKHFADNCQGCIDEVLRGDVRVNNFEEYKAWQLQRMEDDLAGKNDHTFTFLQRAYYFQTGECLALLP